MLGAIQAGGLSSRMGKDKAWLMIEGRALIEYSLAAIHPVVESLAVVASPLNSKYRELAEKWQASLLEDRLPGCGPLAGLESALRAAESDVMALACDMPFVTTSLLQRLRQTHEAAGAEATIAIDSADRLQPLVGVYGAACLPHIEAMLDARDYKVDLLFSRVSVQFVPFDDRFLTNINTREDYLAAKLSLHKGGP